MPKRKSGGGQGQGYSSGSPIGRPLSIPYSPPAGQVRQATGQVLPTTTGGYLNALLGVAVGTAVGVIVPGLMPVSEKWAGALVTGGLALALLLTSPVASVAQEAGLGMFGASVGYFYYDLTGQLCSNTSTAAVVEQAAPVIQLPVPPDHHPWEELGYTG